jgi:phosphopantothenoylcysteine decarboxylase/phosphopantothenate--cysteine ligase
VQLSDPLGVHVTRVETAVEMHAAALEAFKTADIGIATAAVADFRAKSSASEKLHRNEMPAAIELHENPDILSDWGKQKRNNQLLVGFALESDDGVNSAKSKLERKNLDMIVLNSTADPGAGFGRDTNKISVFEQNGNSHIFELKSKEEVAQDIVQLIQIQLQQ